MPELYCSRALAWYGLASHASWEPEKENAYYVHALNDLQKAQALGMDDYRINMFKAAVLRELKRTSEAITEISRAIAKNNKDPRCFWIRARVRDAGPWFDNTRNLIQADQEHAAELAKDWKWTDH